jgi:hypothetical protein
MIVSCKREALEDEGAPVASAHSPPPPQVEAHCQEQGLIIVGYYHANEGMDDTDLPAAAKKIASKIHAQCPHAAALLVQRRTPPGAPVERERERESEREQQSVATPQAARGCARPPCGHFKIQSCCCLGSSLEAAFQTLRRF